MTRPGRARARANRFRSQTVLLWLIVLAAALLRLVFLTDRSLWFDEAFSWRLIQFPPREFLERAAADVHPVLYYAVLWLWTFPARLAGVTNSLFVLRSLSVALSAATVGATFFLGRLLFRSRWTGTTAAALVSVNAFQLQYAWEARMFALGTLLLVLTMAALSKTTAARSRGAAWRWGIAYGIAAGAFLHVHYYALASVAAFGLFSLLLFLNRFIGTRRVLLRPAQLWALLAGHGIAGILFLPWLPVFLTQTAQVRAQYWIPPMEAWSIPTTFATLLIGAPTGVARSIAVLGTLLAVLVVFVSVMRGRTRGDLLAVLAFLVPLAAAAAVSRETSIYQDRYFVFAGIAFLLLIARVLSLLPHRTIFAALVVLGSLGAIMQTWAVLDLPHKPGTAGAAAFLARRAHPDEPIVVSSPFIYFSTAFHLGCALPHGDGRCASGRTPRLFSESGAFAHFAGGPILTDNDIVGPAVFRQAARKLWAVDTTGFSGSVLPVPAAFRLASEERFPEPFRHQGEIIVREFVREE